MTLDDILYVEEIERQCFSEPWSKEGILTYFLRDDVMFLVAVDENSENDASADDRDEELSDDEYYEKYGIEYREEVRDGKIAGFLCLLMVPDEADILKVAVRPEYRRMGTGRMIIDEMKRKAPKYGVYNIFLEVRKSNSAAIGLYGVKGFFKVGERRNYYTSPVEDALVMKLELNKSNEG